VTGSSAAALLVLEGPWWTPEQKPKRPSVLPFFEGMENYRGDFNIYYSNFYEKNGFIRALRDDLTHTREGRLFLYVAAHGYQRMFGGLASKRGMQLSTLLRELKNAANYSNIEGVVLGSCTVGSNVEEFMNTIKSSKIVWMFGYTCEIDWMTSTLIDLSVFEQMMGLEKGLLRNRQQILDRFARALRRFDQDYPICSEGASPVRLADAITLVIQPRGRGRRPEDATSMLQERLGWSREGG
jgi:hypothetical protein